MRRNNSTGIDDPKDYSNYSDFHILRISSSTIFHGTESILGKDGSSVGRCCNSSHLRIMIFHAEPLIAGCKRMCCNASVVNKV